jgi:20S proteasome alpha/beta subunit
VSGYAELVYLSQDSAKLIRRKPLKHDMRQLINSGEPHPMTLCIAALCKLKNEDAIALLTDSQATHGDYFKSDDEYKWRYVGRSIILLSGTVSVSDELIAILSPTIRSFDRQDKPEGDFDLRISQFLQAIRTKVADFKVSAIDNYLKLNYAVSRAEFLRDGKNDFPPTKYDDILLEIQTLEIGTSLLISYSSDEEPIIIRISSTGKVTWHGNYVSIGSGENIATAIMCQEDYDEDLPFMDCLTRLYMAKIAAHRDPYVGRRTFVAVLTKEGRAFDLSDEGFSVIRRRARVIRFPKAIPFEDRFLDEIPPDN